MKAVIDCFASSPKGEGALAVLLLPADAEGAALNLPRKLLPPKAKEGSWLTLDIVAGQPRNLKLNEDVLKYYACNRRI